MAAPSFAAEDRAIRSLANTSGFIMLRIVTLLMLLGALGCGDAHDNRTPISVETPEGSVTAHEFTVDPTPQTIIPVKGDALTHLQSLSKDAPSFAAAYLPGVVEPQLKDYDMAFRAWQNSSAPAHSQQQVVEILGACLGNKCVADFDMEWVTVTDELGTDYAVRSKSVEVMAFPFSTVLKRIEDRQYDFLHGVYYTIKQGITSGECKARARE